MADRYPAKPLAETAAVVAAEAAVLDAVNVLAVADSGFLLAAAALQPRVVLCQQLLLLLSLVCKPGVAAVVLGVHWQLLGSVGRPGMAAGTPCTANTAGAAVAAAASAAGMESKTPQLLLAAGEGTRLCLDCLVCNGPGCCVCWEAVIRPRQLSTRQVLFATVLIFASAQACAVAYIHTNNGVPAVV